MSWREQAKFNHDGLFEYRDFDPNVTVHFNQCMLQYLLDKSDTDEWDEYLLEEQAAVLGG